MKKDKNSYLKDLEKRLKMLEDKIIHIKEKVEVNVKEDAETYKNKIKDFIQNKAKLQKRINDLKKTSNNKWSQLTNKLEDKFKELETIITDFKKKHKL